VGIVKDIAFRMLHVAQLDVAVLEAEVAIGEAWGEPVVAEGNLALVGTYEDGTHLGAGILAPLGDVVGEGEEALVPLGGHGESFS
jgi:hypothetical protein